MNARVIVHASPGEHAFSVVVLDGGLPVAEVPITTERLPYASQIDGRVRLTPTTALDPSTEYAVCHWLAGAPDAGVVECSGDVQIGSFTTGTTEHHGPPRDATGLILKVDPFDFPDAGPNLFCGPERRVRGITVQVPDGGSELLYFARAGDAGVFSAERGSSLPTGIWTPDGQTAGILACDGEGHVPMVSWGIPTGTTELEIWTEDIAGNASEPQRIPLTGDCSPQPSEEAPSEAPPAQGCAAAGAGGIGALSFLAFAFCRARRATSAAAGATSPRSSPARRV